MFSKINAWLHLWLGLSSGIVVIILSITGCVLVFQEDLKYLLNDHLRVSPRTADEQLPPSAIYQAAQAAYPDKEVSSVWYHGLDRSVMVRFENSDTLAYVNPYTTEVLAAVDHEDIFHFMDEGHRHLWMAPAIGRPIVGWATFLFALVTISGLILWWPKKWNKRQLKQAFAIKWNGRFKRVNYDLHNVLGFYSMILALLMALTGLIMSFPWMRKSVVWLTGGYPQRPQTEQRLVPVHDDATEIPDALYAADHIWLNVRKEIARHNKEAVIVHFPHDHDHGEAGDHHDEPIYACTDMINGSWRDLSFDRHTLELLPRAQKPLSETNLTEWTMRSNFALHTGYIGGMTTKILYFLASLICASLPITGFYIWWGKQRKPSANPQRLTYRSRQSPAHPR